MKDVNILIEALPYIKKFHDKKIMIKYGGHAMIDDDAMASTARDTVLLKYVGMQPLVVHGGGPEISRSMDKLGKEPKFIKGLRVTDEETMEIIKMVLVGKISTNIVSQICYHDESSTSSGFGTISETEKQEEFIHSLPFYVRNNCVLTFYKCTENSFLQNLYLHKIIIPSPFIFLLLSNRK